MARVGPIGADRMDGEKMVAEDVEAVLEVDLDQGLEQGWPPIGLL